MYTTLVLRFCCGSLDPYPFQTIPNSGKASPSSIDIFWPDYLASGKVTQCKYNSRFFVRCFLTESTALLIAFQTGSPRIANASSSNILKTTENYYCSLRSSGKTFQAREYTSFLSSNCSNTFRPPHYSLKSSNIIHRGCRVCGTFSEFNL